MWKVQRKVFENSELYFRKSCHSPLTLLQLHNRDAEMSMMGEKWRDQFVTTLCPINWVLVQDKGSKILWKKLGEMKNAPSDCLHQEYHSINLGITSDRQQLKLPLVMLCES